MQLICAAPSDLERATPPLIAELFSTTAKEKKKNEKRKSGVGGGGGGGGEGGQRCASMTHTAVSAFEGLDIPLN